MGDLQELLADMRFLIDRAERVLSAIPIAGGEELDPAWDRRQTGAYIHRRCGFGSAPTLSDWARRGIGPEYEIVKTGRGGAGRAIYRKSNVDRWIAERLQQPERRGRPRTKNPSLRTLARRRAEAVAAGAAL